MKLKLILLFIAITMLCISCSSTLRVVFPVPTVNTVVDYKVTPDNKYEITVKFNRPIDINTVVVGMTFKLVTEVDSNADGVITWYNRNKTAVFISDKEYTDLGVWDPDSFFNIVLIGSDDGQGAIKDTNGVHLDGDGDGNDGGNFSFDFTTIG